MMYPRESGGDGIASNRKDNKGRTLNKGEYQKESGIYEYRYKEVDGTTKSVYSWRLTQVDKAPKNKSSELCLREMIQKIERDRQDGINSAEARKMTLNTLFEEYIANKAGLKQSTRTNYKYMYKKYISTGLGLKKIGEIKYTDILKFYNFLV